jgi:outer membrane protein assembly factor BamB
MRRRLVYGGAGTLIVALIAAGAYVLHVRHAGRDIRGSSTDQFITTVAAPVVTGPGVVWPAYGFDASRRRVAVGITIRPPFRQRWLFHAQSLVEFPPVIAYGRLYFATNSGKVFAVNATTGLRAWAHSTGRCQAASPAVAQDMVYVVFLNPLPCNASGGKGHLVAYWAGSGNVRWSRPLGPSETSPVVVGDSVYVGDWDGYVYAFSAHTGRLWWKFKADGKIKGGVAVAGGRVYFGTYGSSVYAVSAITGKEIWRSSAQSRLGSSGHFYATPAVAYGRVYVGATDGKVYSFGADTGDLIWSHYTGGYVYSSSAVWHDLVFTGSYSGRFSAYDAATGDTRWTFDADGRISGSPTVVAGIVYFATLKGTTYGVDALTGKQVWTFPDGKYSPVVADAHHLYLTGYGRIYGLEPSRPVG